MEDRHGISRCSPAAGSSSSGRGARRDEGFSLIEVCFAAFIIAVILSSVAQLLAVAITAERMARNGTLAARMAQGKLDELMRADFATNPQIQLTPVGVDSLSADVANYFDTPQVSVTRRWRVSQGPANTRIVAVRVLAARGTTTARAVDLTTLVRPW